MWLKRDGSVQTRLASVLTGVLWVVYLGSASNGNAQNIQNHTTEGNLEPTRDPGCIPYVQADNRLTPADLSLGVLACASEGNYRDAVDLFVLMQLRAVFDSKRVADKSAGQAGAVLASNIRQALGPPRLEKLQAAYGDIGGNDSPWHAEFCTQMQKSGAPDYFPHYMIQHGIKAFTNSGEDPLVAGFEPDDTWREMLVGYLKCS